jgi:hypothetical protein
VSFDPLGPAVIMRLEVVGIAAHGFAGFPEAKSATCLLILSKVSPTYLYNNDQKRSSGKLLLCCPVKLP